MKTEFDNAGDNVYFCNQSVWPELNVTVDLHKWTSADREALMALCNAVDRTFLSDRLPYPYTEADADWWLGMVAAIGYMILTPFWSQGIGTEAVRQICEIAFRELALERIIGEVFPENLASARVLEKNGFRLEETKSGAVVKGGKAMDVRLYGLPR